jgi:hypothetical protein
VTLGNDSASEPLLNFQSWRRSPLLALSKIPSQQVFPGSSATLDVSCSDRLLAKSDNALLKVTATRVSESDWRVVLRAAPEWKPGDKATVQLTSPAGGKPQAASFSVTPSAVKLAGLLTHTAGTLSVQSANADDGVAVATVNWPGAGAHLQRKIGTNGFVLFRLKGTQDARPTHKVMAPFKDSFTGNDGFWYGEAAGNMRFDLDGAPGQDKNGVSYFGSVNTNAGTPDDGPQNSWKIQVEDEKPHLLTVFSPAMRTQGAAQSIILTAADGSSQVVPLDGTQGGAIVQFQFIGNVTLTLKQNAGGMGAPRPGAGAAALFFD